MALCRVIDVIIEKGEYYLFMRVYDNQVENNFSTP